MEVPANEHLPPCVERGKGGRGEGGKRSRQGETGVVADKPHSVEDRNQHVARW